MLCKFSTTCKLLSFRYSQLFCPTLQWISTDSLSTKCPFSEPRAFELCGNEAIVVQQISSKSFIGSIHLFFSSKSNSLRHDP